MKQSTRAFVSALSLVLLGVFFCNESVRAEQVEAFTEPYQRIAVPASEIGVIAVLEVAEGDQVSAGQSLGRLDDAVLQSSLAVAQAAKHATGSLRSAESDVEMRRRHVESYESLSEQGNATSRELWRSQTELQQSLARLQSVREELNVRKLEYKRVEQQIRQRQIASPINGVVVKIDKVAGEFVSPTDPVVLHVVQLNKLKAVFSVPRPKASGLAAGQVITMTVGYDGQTCEGTIEFVSPVTDPESNTVRVKVRIENQDREVASGISCRWNMDARSQRNQDRRNQNRGNQNSIKTTAKPSSSVPAKKR